MAKLSQHENFGKFLLDAIDKGLSGLGELGRLQFIFTSKAFSRLENRKYPISATKIRKNGKTEVEIDAGEQQEQHI